MSGQSLTRTLLSPFYRTALYGKVCPTCVMIRESFPVCGTDSAGRRKSKASNKLGCSLTLHSQSSASLTSAPTVKKKKASPQPLPPLLPPVCLTFSKVCTSAFVMSLSSSYKHPSSSSLHSSHHPPPLSSSHPTTSSLSTTSASSAKAAFMNVTLRPKSASQLPPHTPPHLLPSTRLFKTYSKGSVGSRVQGVWLERIVRGLVQMHFKHIIVMSGAGISTPSGIPDFRWVLGWIYIMGARVGIYNIYIYDCTVSVSHNGAEIGINVLITVIEYLPVGRKVMQL